MKVYHIMSLLQILVILFTIKHCFATKNNFVVIVYSLLVVQKYQKDTKMIVLKLMTNS